jgi:hypothetical protein
MKFKNIALAVVASVTVSIPVAAPAGAEAAPPKPDRPGTYYDGQPRPVVCPILSTCSLHYPGPLFPGRLAP